MQYCQIELTNRCNLSCSGCFRHNLKRGYGDMSFTTFKQTIDLCKKLKLKEVWLHNWGEPLLHPEILKFVKYSAQYFKVGFTSNGTLLTEPMIHNMRHAGLYYLDLSLNKNTPKEYISHLLNIYTIANKIDINCHFRTVIFSDEDFKYFSDLLVDCKVRFQRCIINKNESIRTDDCLAIDKLFFVYFDGTVVPCCRVADKEISYGKVTDKTIVKKIKTGIKKIHSNIKYLKHNSICTHCFEIDSNIPVPYKLKLEVK